VAFVLVPFAVESIWVFWPALQGFYFSLTRWDGLEPPQFIGLDNYTELAGDSVFRGALLNTVIWLVLFGGLSVLGGFGMALLLQKERRGIGSTGPHSSPRWSSHWW
jgi:multiple sugar transport system permease protein/raffinose/stachyose/melibiose transport system permease protein